MVPERAGEMAAEPYEAGQQTAREVFTRRYPRDGHVPRAHGVHPVAAAPQSFVQRHGPPEPELHGLPITVTVPSSRDLKDKLVEYEANALGRLCGLVRFFS